MPYNTLLRPIDICDQCDDLFPLEAITETIKVLKFKKIRVGKGVYARLHHDCVPAWEMARDQHLSSL